MTDPRLGLGRRGEALAVAELERRGYTIHRRNWRCSEGEIDVVAAHDGWLVFVEVRTRRGRELGTPEVSITAAKRARLIRVAHSYLSEFEPEELDWRIDVVAIELEKSGRLARIEVYENAVRG